MKLITVLSGALILCAISVQSEKIEAPLGEINKFEEAPENDEEVESNWFELQHETIEQQADQPTSGEQFIAIRIGAAGSKDEVNPNLVGLVRMATQFLPKSYTFINVLSASREVVAGIKYELLIKALDENKSEVHCEIRILEQPWIITNNNEKLRTLIYSNCSTDQAISNEPKDDVVQYNINPIFNNEEKMMTGERLKDMESLIMANDNKTSKPPKEEISSVQPETIHSRPKEDEDALPVITLSKGTSSFLDDFFSFGKETKPKENNLIENEVIPKLDTQPRIEAVTFDRAEQENTIYGFTPNEKKETAIMPNRETSIAANTEMSIAANTETSIVANTGTSTQAAAVEVNNNEEQVKEEVSIKCALTPTDENAPVSDAKSTSNVDSTNVNVERQKRESLDMMEEVLLTKLINAALARLDRFDEDDNKRILLNVLESRAHRNVFTTGVRIADTKCSEISSSAENCRSQIIDDSIKLCRFEIEHLDNGDIKLKKSECAPEVREKRQVGAPKALPESEQEKVLGYLRASLANGDAPGYKLDRVIEITKQTVSGVLYKIKAQFEVEQSTIICNVNIWDRPWLGESAREVTFKCDDAARRKRQIVGGINSLPNSDGEKLLNEVLSEGDYQSYRLVRLIKSSQQKVAGMLYRIKAEFSVDHLTKVCVVKIWDRPWLGKSGRQVEFNCDGSTRKKRQVPGGISPSSESDKSNKIAGLINEVLTEGDYKSYRLVRIIESTTQRASGTIYKIKGEFLIDQTSKICNIKIWDRPWLGKSGRKVEFNCDESSRPKRQIQGGFKSIKVLEKEIDTDFLSYVENILKDILGNTDYQSYKLIRIIDTTSEVISGFMYRIKAEFSVNGLPKICNIKIWDKESIQEREVQEFICHDPELNIFRDKPLITTGEHSGYEYIPEDAPTSNISTDSSDQEIIQIESLLNTALESTIYKSYKLVGIIEFSKLNVTDIFYRIKASFKINDVEQICDLKLWHKTSDRENAIQEFNCNQKSSNNGFNRVSEEDKPKVEKLLREILAYDDYQSYTLVRILQSWQQFVVGINYKVRAEMKVKGDSKICDIKILTMLTKHGKRVVQTVCKNIEVHNPDGLNSVPNDSPAFIESLVNGVLLQGNYQSFRLVRIIEWSKQTGEYVLYRVKAQFVADGTQQICNLKIRNTISNEGREVQEFICDEPTETILGGISVTSEKDKPVIQNILNEILISGDYPSYKLVRIIEATKQIVKGILYRIKAEFNVGGTTKICNFKIWDKHSNEGREVQEFTCVELSRPLPGGITTTSQDDNPAIQNIVNEVLASGDYQRYTLLRIIESTKQIVAGILYRIRAEFSVDSTPKICNIKIWDKVSHQGREVQEFICEEVASSSVPKSTSDLSQNNKWTGEGSHAPVATTTSLENIPILGGISVTSEDDKIVIENILNGILAGSDYQSYRLVKIIESTKQIVEGILYRIKAEFSVNGTQKICNVKIWDKVSNQGREVEEFICEESAPSIIGGSHAAFVSTKSQEFSKLVPGVVSAIFENNKSTEAGPHATIVNTTFQEHNIPVLGGISATSEDDKTVIESILNGILASGDYQSYRLVRIIEFTKQIVAGILYRIKAEFSVNGTQKICNVKIWDKVSNQGREVQEFICEESAPSIVAGSHAAFVSTISQESSRPVPGVVSATSENNKSTEGEPHATVVNTTFHEHNIPVLGGISATSEDDKTVIKNILNGILTSGDYQSYRLVRIIESTKQIVAGILYRIKAEFSVNGTQKICNVKIWDKVSNQRREVQEFICEESAPSIVAGSHAAFVGTTSQESSKPLSRVVSATSENNKSTEAGPHATVMNTIFHEHNIPILGGITPTSEDDKTVIENILNGILASGDYQSYRLVRIIESTKQIVAGILYRIKAEFSVNGTQKICNVKIWDKVSNQGREVQEFICEESAPSIVAGSHVAFVSTTSQESSKPLSGVVSATSENNKSIEAGPHATVMNTIFHEHNIPILGGISPTSEDDKTVIENILNGLLASGEYQSYRLVRIIESTKQIVAGILYRIKAEFSVNGTQKICNVKIWDKVSNQGREVQEFICEQSAPSIVVGSHAAFVSTTSQESSRPVPGVVIAISENNKSTEGEPHANVVNTTFHEHNIPILGGISATSEDDKTVIENIVNGVLASGEYQSYRLVRIIESTKQIVAGILYRIKAEFSVNGTQKICNVKIWDKVSNQGREVQEFICEESAPSIVGGSHVAFVGTTSQESSRPVPEVVSAIFANNKSTEGEPHANVVYTTFHEHNIPILGGISPTSEDDKTVIENILKGILASGDYKSYRLVRIIESTKQIVAGILYRIKAEFSVNGTQKICNVKIWDKVSNQGREVQEFSCEESAPSIVAGSHAAFVGTTSQESSRPVPGVVIAISENNKSTEGEPHANVVNTTFHEHNIPILGGISATSEDDQTVIENIVNGVLASGEYQSYRLVRIIESTKQIVAGILYRIKAEFSVNGTQKICNVKIWDKVSNQGREVQEFICEESAPSIVVDSYAAFVGTTSQESSRPVPGVVSAISENNKSTEGEPHANVVNTTFHEHNIPILGGISATSEDDKTVIENILNGILTSGDYQSYRLVRIIESTKQIVAGILYRIKAEFSVNGTQKICNVKIWDKVSNQGREVQEFICEQSAPSIVVGSHAAFVSTTSQESSRPVPGVVIAISENNKSTEGEPHANVVNTTFHEHNIPILGGISATSEDDKTVIENIVNGVLASGEYQSYRLVRIIESTKQIVAGILYRIKAEFSVNGTQKICNVKIWDKVSNQGREVQEFICEESAPSIVGGSHVAFVGTTSQESSRPVPEVVSAISANNKSTEGEPHANVVYTTFHEHNIPILGGISPTSEDDKTVIENILKGILASGDYKSYRLVRIIESTKQIVAGILYRIKAEFSVNGTQKICNVKIWDKVSNQGREVEQFICEESAPSIVVGSHAALVSTTSQESSRPLSGVVSATSENNKSTEAGPHATVMNTIFHEHNIPILGGISATSEDDKTVIENILNGILTSGDYQSYRLVRIIESTKQIVAGILYRIKAEFSVNGTQKICNVKIWDKVSNQGREVQEFICEQSAPSIVVGSHAAFVSTTSQESSRPVPGVVIAISENNKSTEGEPHANVVNNTFHEHDIPILGGISATSEDDKTVIENIVNGVLASGEYQSYRLVRIIESTKQIVAGILYRIKAEFSVNGTQKICNVKIWDKVSNQGREVQEFICEESAPSIVGGSHVAFVGTTSQESSRPVPGVVSAISANNKSTEGEPHANVVYTTFHEHNIPILGGISPTSEDDKTVIENILNGLLASGEYQSYRLVRIIESTKQIVAGILYRIKAEFSVNGTQKICNVKIWDKVSNQGREVQEFICEQSAPSIVVGSHASFVSTTSQESSRPIPGVVSAISENNKSTEGEAHANVVNTTFHEHNIPILGGITPTSEDDKTVIENIVNGVLASGEYQSYRLVRIIESTKQIVAGILYRIKAEFSVNGTQKICNVKIWDKVSNQGREVQEFSCEESAPSIVAGSHAAFVGTTSQESSRPVPGVVIAISENNKSTEGEPHANVVNTTFHEHNIPILGGISATSEDDQTVIENIVNGVLASGEYQSYRLVRIIESTKQIVAGILYRIKAEFSVNGTQKICNVKIWDKVSNQGREVQEFICEESAPSIVVDSHAAFVGTTSQESSRPVPGVVSAISENNKSTEGEPHANVVNATFHEHNIPILGGISATSEDDQTVIENILNGILTSGDYQSYRLVRIIESTKQIVAGILYRIKAEFSVNGTQKICNVKIWDKVSNQGREVEEFICEESAPSIVVGSDAAFTSTTSQESSRPGPGVVSAISENNKSTEGEPHANVVNTTFHEHNIPILGGISATSEDDKTVIENILNGLLASGEYQSYRLVRIIESTKQIVAGILYRIKAEFSIDGTQKMCNVKIWDKVSNLGREVQEFICEGPASAVKEESLDALISTTTHDISRPPAESISVSLKDDKSVVENILNGILAGGDYQSYKLVRLNEFSSEVNEGILYRINADFLVNGVDHICAVKIWDRSSRQGEIRHKISCRQTFPILSGFNSVPLDDISSGQSLLIDILAYDDYHKYKLVKVIESWRQIVDGVNYKIKAELTEKGVPKICNILILGKLTESGKHVAEFDCKNIAEADHNIQGHNTSITVADNSKIESLLTEVLSQGDFQSYRLVRIIESTIETLSGILYRIKAEFEVDGSSNVCIVKIWDRSWLGKSERQVKIKCDEQSRHKRQIPGGVLAKSVTDMKTESILNEVLVAGDYSSYRLIRIIESTTQVVAGSLYRIKAEFSVDQSTKVCTVKIWDRPWLGKAARQVEFNCDGLSRRKRQIRGGITPVSEEHKPYVANLLNEVLTAGDYQSYRLVKIIETSRQVVAGTLYRIKAEFDLDGAEKICDITIWKKINNEENEVTKFSCVRKRAIKRRSHGSSSSSSESSGSSESSERSNKNKIRNVLYDVLDDDDYKSYSLVRINQGSRQKLSSRTLYYIEAIFLVDRNEIQCNVNINQRSRTDRKVHFNCDQPTLLSPPSGGTFTITPISERAYIQNLVTEVLSKGEYKSYRLLRIIEASNQEASGYKYRIKADFAVEQVEKICVIIIWVKLSNLGKEITEFTCEEPQGEQEQNTVFLWRKTRQVLGGTTKVSEFDKPHVESLLNDVLLAGEYQLYSLIEIIESTKQTVQGILYTIKAKFNIDGKTQICTVTIWDRPWLGKSSREVEFKECVGDTSGRAKREVPAPGSVRSVEQNEYPKIEEMLNTALAAGDQQNYRFVKIVEATKQTVAGLLYRVKAEFSVDEKTKICKIKILVQPWKHETPEVQFDCNEDVVD